jgi:hypothetical protein
MFCSNCGNSMEGVVTACTTCGYAATQPAPDYTGEVRSAAFAALKDAWTVQKQLVRNPVGGVQSSFESLGERRAMIAGITLGAAFALVVMALVLVTSWRLHFAPSMKTLFGTFVLGIVPFVGIAGASAAARAVFRGGSTFAADAFLAGVALQPVAILLILSAILGVGNGEVIAILGVVTWTCTILMLFAGSTRIAAIPENVAPIAVSFMLLLSLWLCKIIVSSFFGSANPLGAIF